MTRSTKENAMPHFGVCAWIYGDVPLERTLARIAAAGYDGVEIPGEPDAFDPASVRRALTNTGLVPVGLTASCMVPATRRDLAHPDPAVRADAVGYLVACLRFAAEIGAPLTQMLPSGETRLAPIGTRAEEWAWSVAAMQDAAREAERLGVKISVEPLNRYEAYLVTNADEALAYIAAVDSSWVGMTLDLFHAHLEEPDIRRAILKAGPRLLHVHVADTNRQGLGRGHLDVAACLHTLQTIGYAGSIVLEVMPPGPNPFQSIKDARSAEVLDGYLRESIAVLRDGWENARRVPAA
jgi:D-psicose/D-tagatose/L-ribulose 3-epimerase